MLRGALRIGSVALLVVCLLWMDICLYYHIQTMTTAQNHNETSNTSHIYKKINNSNNHHYNDHKRIPPKEDNARHKSSISSSNDRLRSMKATISEPPSLIIANDRYDHLRTLIGMFSFAFRGLSVKLMMTDPIDNYLLGPLADAFGDLCNFRDNFQFISANMVSVAGVLSALVAAKLVSRQNSPCSHKLAFVFFQIRTWLDNLDGVVARSRMGINKHVSLSNTSGYVVDGVCDAIGFLAFIWGTYLYLKQSHFVTYRHLKADSGGSSASGTSQRTGETRPSHKRLLLLVALFLIQLALCSAGWNKYILEYNELLESPSAHPLEATSKLKILQSNIMFIIIWFWRLTNGHSWMQFLAISVLMGKVWHFLEFIKFIGFVEILILVSVTHLHTIDIKNYLTVVAG